MKKYLLVISMLVLVSLIFVSCTGAKENTAPTKAPAATATKEAAATKEPVKATATPVPTAKPTPSPEPTIDVNVKAPVADIFDLKFAQDGTPSNGVADSGILEIKGSPVVALDDTIKMQAATFTGGSGCNYKIPIAEFYDQIELSFTLEGYIKVDVSPETEGVQYMNPLSNMQSGGFGFELYASDEGEDYVDCRQSVYIDGQYEFTYADVLVGKYFHVVSTYDGSVLKHYIDGKLVDTLDCSGTFALTSSENSKYLCVGADSCDSGLGEAGFKGSVAVAKLYSKALTASEVAKLYADLTTAS